MLAKINCLACSYRKEDFLEFGPLAIVWTPFHVKNVLIDCVFNAQSNCVIPCLISQAFYKRLLIHLEMNPNESNRFFVEVKVLRKFLERA